MKILNLALVTLVVLSARSGAEPAAARDQWGHWRGPTGNGTSETADPPVHWNEKKNVRWKIALPGRGSSSPVVWGDRIFVTAAVGPQEGDAPRSPQKFTLLCVDRTSGAILWQRVAAEAVPHEGHHAHHGFASASPMTDGQTVFAHFGSRGLFAYDFEGELRWSRTDFGEMRTRNGFGEGSSPAMRGDTVIVPWDHEGQSKLIALDKAGGETRWTAMRDEPTSWDTPLIIAHDGVVQVVTSGENFAAGYDLADGAELWRCPGQTQRPVACAVGADGVVYVGSGFRGAFLGAIRLSGRGNLAGTDAVVWTKDEHTPDIPSLLLSRGRLYYNARKSAIFTCVDAATGKPHWERQRIDGLGELYASPVAAAGRIYITGRDGATTVIKDADHLEVLATNKLSDPVDATPALAGQDIVIRGARHLYLISRQPG